MSCKKGGFKTLSHDRIRDITAKLLSGLCKDVRAEPSLLKLNGEDGITRRATKRNDEVRLDVSTRRFWVNGQTAFFDVRVFDPSARRYLNQTLKQCYYLNEK